MALRTLNVAMVGYQFMGRAHSNAWRQVGRFFELPAEPVLKVVCGRTEGAVREAAARLGWEEHSTSWQESIERPDIDIVDICTPGDSHLPIALAAAAAGHMVCHNYRRAPAVALAKRIIQDGRLGVLRHFRGTYLQDWIVDPEFPRVWRLEKARAGSGSLGDIASHSLDLARYLVGEIREVCGLLETFVKERPLPDSSGRGPVDVDDAALALLRFENGAIGSVEGSRFAPGRKNHNRFEINGSLGSLAFDLERMNELELYLEEGPDSGFRTVLATDADHPYVEAWWPPGHILGYEHTFVHTALDLLRAIDEQKLPTPSFEDGVRNQRVLEAIERANASRRWEAV
jgi:predicted dehydrogenase